jgi:hypothetical protein
MKGMMGGGNREEKPSIAGERTPGGKGDASRTLRKHLWCDMEYNCLPPTSAKEDSGESYFS